jgi:hypothetical protein
LYKVEHFLNFLSITLFRSKWAEKPKIIPKIPKNASFFAKKGIFWRKCEFFFVPLQGKIIKDGKKEDIIHQSGDISVCSRQRIVNHGQGTA